MYTANLFVGMEITPPIDHFLKQTDKNELQYFINEEEPYLHELKYQGARYLGKFAGQQIDVASLEQLEENIKTLLSKVITPDLLSDSPLYLLSILEDQ